MTIAQCFRCPKAYHLKCYSKDKILKINKKVIICQDHKTDNKFSVRGGQAANNGMSIMVWSKYSKGSPGCKTYMQPNSPQERSL